MPHRLCRLAGTAFAAVLLAGALEPAAAPGGAAPAACAAQAADGPEPRPHCCFTNARYVGTCEVEPSKDETCATILQYLNNPQSQGKTYCNATSVRGGWKQVPCQPKDAGD